MCTRHNCLTGGRDAMTSQRKGYSPRPCGSMRVIFSHAVKLFPLMMLIIGVVHSVIYSFSITFHHPLRSTRRSEVHVPRSALPNQLLFCQVLVMTVDSSCAPSRRSAVVGFSPSSQSLGCARNGACLPYKWSCGSVNSPHLQTQRRQERK